MRSNALCKFSAKHPESHNQFRDLIQSAKRPELLDQNNLEREVYNMLLNNTLTRYREEDDSQEGGKTKKTLKKKLSWSKNLIDVKIVLPWKKNPMPCLLEEQF